MVNIKKLGDRIRKARERLKITQEEVAYRADLDYSYYNQIEMGRRSPSVKALSRIAKAIGIPLKELF